MTEMAGVTQDPMFYVETPTSPDGNVSYTITRCLTPDNQTVNCTLDGDYTDSHTQLFETVVRIVVPIIFSTIVVLGFTGNMLVIIVVLANRQMRNTTNLLILSLSVADLFFIIICVPFTAMGYAMTTFPFGIAWCRIYQYVIQVTAYVSIYTLVLMSFDRYLAVVHPISSMTLRTERNTVVVIVLCWIVILLCNIPLIFQYGVIEYPYYGEIEIRLHQSKTLCGQAECADNVRLLLRVRICITISSDSCFVWNNVEEIASRGCTAG